MLPWQPFFVGFIHKSAVTHDNRPGASTGTPVEVACLQISPGQKRSFRGNKWSHPHYIYDKKRTYELGDVGLYYLRNLRIFPSLLIRLQSQLDSHQRKIREVAVS